MCMSVPVGYFRFLIFLRCLLLSYSDRARPRVCRWGKAIEDEDDGRARNEAAEFLVVLVIVVVLSRVRSIRPGEGKQGIE